MGCLGIKKYIIPLQAKLDPWVDLDLLFFYKISTAVTFCFNSLDDPLVFNRNILFFKAFCICAFRRNFFKVFQILDFGLNILQILGRIVGCEDKIVALLDDTKTG